MKYLASPYSHPDPEMQHLRYLMACQAAAHLMKQGHIVFSPIAHSHGIARFVDGDHAFWMRQDLEFLRNCDEMVVLTLPGWDRSDGIRQEIEFAEAHGIAVRYMDFDEVIG